MDKHKKKDKKDKDHRGGGDAASMQTSFALGRMSDSLRETHRVEAIEDRISVVAVVVLMILGIVVVVAVGSSSSKSTCQPATGSVAAILPLRLGRVAGWEQANATGFSGGPVAQQPLPRPARRRRPTGATASSTTTSTITTSDDATKDGTTNEANGGDADNNRVVAFDMSNADDVDVVARLGYRVLYQALRGIGSELFVKHVTRIAMRDEVVQAAPSSGGRSPADASVNKNAKRIDPSDVKRSSNTARGGVTERVVPAHKSHSVRVELQSIYPTAADGASPSATEADRRNPSLVDTEAVTASATLVDLITGADCLTPPPSTESSVEAVELAQQRWEACLLRPTPFLRRVSAVQNVASCAEDNAVSAPAVDTAGETLRENWLARMAYAATTYSDDGDDDVVARLTTSVDATAAQPRRGKSVGAPSAAASSSASSQRWRTVSVVDPPSFGKRSFVFQSIPGSDGSSSAFLLEATPALRRAVRGDFLADTSARAIQVDAVRDVVQLASFVVGDASDTSLSTDGGGGAASDVAGVSLLVEIVLDQPSVRLLASGHGSPARRSASDNAASLDDGVVLSVVVVARPQRVPVPSGVMGKVERLAAAVLRSVSAVLSDAHWLAKPSGMLSRDDELRIARSALSLT